MKVRIVDESVPVYPEMDPDGISVYSLHAGDHVEIMKITRRKGKSWVHIQRPDGQMGFVMGNTRVFAIRKVQLDQKQAVFYSEPSVEADQLGTLARGARLVVQDVKKVEGSDGWVKVVTPEGQEGWISGKARIRVLPDNPVENGRRQMIYAAMWLAGAILIVVYLQLTNPESQMIMLGYGAGIIGLLQLVQGFTQYQQGKREQRESKQ